MTFERRTPPFSVLVVDDSALMRQRIRDLLSREPDFRVVGTARDGHDALRKVHDLDPDLVTLDVEMPALDGLGALGYIMSETPRPVVMLSAHTRAGADLSLRALDLGAVDFVAKSSGPASPGFASVGEQLLEALRAAAEANLSAVRVKVPRPEPPPPERPDGAGSAARRAIGIAASTGGPRALAELVPRLPCPLGAAVLVVQHMPAHFTRSFAGRLNAVGPLPVAEAVHGEAVLQDRVYLAPGDLHMRVVLQDATPRIALEGGASVWEVRPAADPLFCSLAERFGSASIGVVLTGMGRDGTAGLHAIRNAGGYCIAQDRSSSVVYGMPRAAAGAADRILSLEQIPGALAERLRRRSLRERGVAAR